jgi:hypothetical protein
MKQFLFGLAVMLGLGACTPAATASAPLAVAGAVVMTARDAWNAAAEGCVAAATATNNDLLRQSCEKILDPAKDVILAAASAVDAGNASSIACAMADVAVAMAKVDQALASSGVTVPPLVSDVVSLAQGFAGGCVQDAAPADGSAQ